MIDGQKGGQKGFGSGIDRVRAGIDDGTRHGFADGRASFGRVRADI